jgi:hypothetical protein
LRCTSIAAARNGKLEAESVIRRQGDGFPLDQSRVAYLRYLRRERRAISAPSNVRLMRSTVDGVMAKS